MPTVHTYCSQAYKAAVEANPDLDDLNEDLRKTILKSYKTLIKANKDKPIDVFLGCIICGGRTLNVRASAGSMRCTSFYCKNEYKKKKEATNAAFIGTSELDSASASVMSIHTSCAHLGICVHAHGCHSHLFLTSIFL